jgi:CRP-like cAMP-binding protein
MYRKIKGNITQYVPFTEQEVNIFLSKMHTKLIPKNEIYLREGEICKHVAFINEGLMRIYYVKEGREFTSRFSLTNQWVSEYASFLHQKPSVFYIQALKDTELLVLNYDDMQALYKLSSVFERFGRLLAEQLYIDILKKYSSLFLNSPAESYQELLNENRQILHLIPLKYIASSVGIAPESLSRIRKRMNTPSSKKH